MRRFPTYTDARISLALSRAREATGWPKGMALTDCAGAILAGHDADQAAIDDASRQVALLMDRV